jgi:hypothetical protein
MIDTQLILEELPIGTARGETWALSLRLRQNDNQISMILRRDLKAASSNNHSKVEFASSSRPSLGSCFRAPSRQGFAGILQASSPHGSSCFLAMPRSPAWHHVTARCGVAFSSIAVGYCLRAYGLLCLSWPAMTSRPVRQAELA